MKPAAGPALNPLANPFGWRRRTWMRLAALSGFMAVAAGAFGAHALEDGQVREWLKTAAHYQFMHAMATLASATFINSGGRQAAWAPGFFLGGTVLFCGSLYAMVLGAPTWLGAVTPLGGVSFLIGWAILARSASYVDRVQP